MHRPAVDVMLDANLDMYFHTVNGSRPMHCINGIDLRVLKHVWVHLTLLLAVSRAITFLPSEL